MPLTDRRNCGFRVCDFKTIRVTTELHILCFIQKYVCARIFSIQESEKLTECCIMNTGLRFEACKIRPYIKYLTTMWPLPLVRQLALGISSWSHEFDYRRIHLGFVVVEVALVQIFLSSISVYLVRIILLKSHKRDFSTRPVASLQMCSLLCSNKKSFCYKEIDGQILNLTVRSSPGKF